MLLWFVVVGLLLVAFFGVLPPGIAWPLFGVALVASIIDGLWTVRQVRRTNVAMGTKALIGQKAVVRTPFTPRGYVFIRGERWQAEMDKGATDPVSVGECVRIVGAEGFHLLVCKLDEPPTATLPDD